MLLSEIRACLSVSSGRPVGYFRQVNGENRAPAQLALHAYPALVDQDDMLDNGQPQAETGNVG